MKLTLKNTSNRREYWILTIREEYGPYYEECMRFHKSKGIKKFKTKEVSTYEFHIYRTWKHNRKTQFKIGM